MKTSIVLFLLTLGIMQYFVRLAKAECIHAPDSEKRKEELQKKTFNDYLQGVWTYNIIEAYRKNARPERSANLIDTKVKHTRISGEPSCRKNRNVTQESNISVKSSCPWYVVLDVDFQRQPQYIAKAKCSCKRCLKVDRTGKTRDRCTEVNSFIPVIKWRCPNNFAGTGPNYFEYFEDIETVPVGCTCKRPFEV